MKLTIEQIEILKKYNIDYDVKTKTELLVNIDLIMTNYLDKNDEPTEDFRILEKLYDIYYEFNKFDIIKYKEKELINMKELLVAELERMQFRKEEIEDIIDGLKPNRENIIKLYNYIIDNKINDTDDVFKYYFKLLSIDNQTIVIEK